MNIPKIHQQISLMVEDLGSHGEGVGKCNGFTIFVEGALPGEVVTVQIFEIHRRFARARLLCVDKPSTYRVTPPCPLFGKCGGCQLMHLSYQQQLEMKRRRIVEALSRIGNITEVEVNPCQPSPKELGYRNKIQLPVKNTSKGLELGLYAVSSHELVPISTCQIHCSIGDEVYREVSSIIKSSGITAYDPLLGKGELRHVLIKSALHLNQVLVVLVTAQHEVPKLSSISKAIMLKCPSVKGVVQNVNLHNDNTILGKTYTLLDGVDRIKEKLGELTFNISPASFFQVNPGQAAKLYAQALAFADLNGTETVLDAYCGVGTLSLFFASNAKKIVGVECVPEAIVDAKANAKLNQIENVSFVCESSEDYVSKLKAVDVALLNPPRKGCSPQFLREIARLAPKKVIYISCDPATLARDLALLRSLGYCIEAIQPFDMFPQTSHVETVVRICSKSSIG